MSENLRMLLMLIWRGVGLKMGEDFFFNFPKTKTNIVNGFNERNLGSVTTSKNT